MRTHNEPACQSFAQAWTRTIGGRENGASRSFDGCLDIRLSIPGSRRIGTNAEQLFAAAWSARFESAIFLAARRRKIALSARIAIEAEADLKIACLLPQHSGKRELPGIDRATAQALIDEAHEICPYSKATRGNIHVAIN